ncbi:DNA replication terminus site-binding protein [Erwinia sp. OLTSP20]|uniref:DNA replication terminus site-binding protein n=1 Tax=unclassified Erwinia TaxID=2622719 RepID=UPI000C1808DE|nr:MULTISPECIES: DNA replication terminus site-binding protein [unclassified Erwinia]PIJ51690.1 DNA replication terminus site-binding protein [Erwinia sp. OAMSP11]PIJ75577.1 DNA replication terminus site-binding protein [Erwinia sp. OLSSP12]PIJ84882.1 DNA replication terminus site-binding protein [Erwinia sp. OLCASP19]PIJ86661.1 DNA replication terminus site-binding protein [Erwinia sp. OLMTSP26]PIJ88102.1 DNA replication terminus site-binding protein [Erwinia sp. OLMDSP33]
MSRYQAIERLHQCINALEQALHQLQQQITALPLLAARVFVLPEITKGEEHDPRPQLQVTPLLAQAALAQALQHYSLLFMQQQPAQRSTKSAVRLPGALCLQAAPALADALRQQVRHINLLKNRLEQIITLESEVAAAERFEFVHQQLPGLITLNAYRTITLLDAPDSVRFGWANKQIIQRVDRTVLREKLLASLQGGRAAPGWQREQWADNLRHEIALIDALPAGAQLKIRRPVKVQPVARIWQAQKQKQTQLACPSPLLILCQNADQLPKLGVLANYDQQRITHRHKPTAQQLWPLIPRLHLYSDLPG